jgi:predicted RNA-binding protein with PUA-like domain
MAARWLVKTEPSEYSFDQLLAEGRTIWTGVHNPVALKHLAGMRPGDAVLVYHTGKEKAVVGEARVSSVGPGGVELEAVRRLERAVPLAELKSDPTLGGWDLVRLPRLSVMPVSATQWQAVLIRAGSGRARPQPARRSRAGG